MSFLADKYVFRDNCCSVQYTHLGGTELATVSGPCYSCGQNQEVIVPADALRRFKAGELAQNCFPLTPSDQREFLISGICSKCWDEMFAEFEDE